jgi:tetratricopeptide (TPR) repeat protein
MALSVIRCPLAVAGVLIGLLLAPPATAQTLTQHIARGDSLRAALRPDAALEEYRLALAADSTSYPALWRAAEATVDVAKQLPDDLRSQRDSLYRAAQAYAQAAIQSDSLGADGHFELAQALGRYARTRGGRERVRYGRIIYDEAARALALDPRHDGAHHVLGAWHAEVKRLSPLTRFLAKTLLGGGFLGRASWDSATAHLEQAVALRTEFIFHRLELAQVYLDRHRPDAARAQLTRVATLPVSDVSDPGYQEEARRLLATLARTPPSPDAAAGGAAAAPGGARLRP